MNIALGWDYKTPNFPKSQVWLNLIPSPKPAKTAILCNNTLLGQNPD
jgi:hypothetical protein